MLNSKLLLALVICSLASISRASFPGYVHTKILDIIPPDIPVADFSYNPTPSGYRFSYTLVDGRHHEEVANIVDPNSPEVAEYRASEAKRRSMQRPGGKKNRKLSPKALGSLAG